MYLVSVHSPQQATVLVLCIGGRLELMSSKYRYCNAQELLMFWVISLQLLEVLFCRCGREQGGTTLREIFLRCTSILLVGR